MRDAAFGAIDWLDDKGKAAWIATMVLGFVLFWPVGLAILAYLIWSGRMGCGKQGGRGRWMTRAGSFGGPRAGSGGNRSSGNTAFDEYREETLRRLEDEQREFGDFLSRLRAAKDKAEFDDFMADRRRPRKPGEEQGEPNKRDYRGGGLPDTGPEPSGAY